MKDSHETHKVSGMNRRSVLRGLGMGVLASLFPRLAGQPAAARQPAGSVPKNKPKNILLIITHDSGRHFGCYGESTMQTPAIDRLAAGGCRFDRFFSVNPICSPSRASLITGRYPQSHGLKTIVNKKKGIRMNADERPLAGVLSEAGFETALFGLQHESPESTTLGFKHLHDGFPRKSAVDVGREAGEFIRQTKAPFYVQVGLHETHTPYDFGGATPDATKGVRIPPYVIDDEAAQQWMAAFQGSARQADDGVRLIMDALEASGQADDTLVIFTVDHGIELPRAKWFLYDPGVEVAFICRWPNGGIAAGSQSDLLLSHVDVFPTLMELLGLPVPENVQGVSFAPALCEGSKAPVRTEVFGFQNGYEMRSIRTERYKLIRNFELHAPCTCPGDVRQPRQETLSSPLVELYDLEKDPREFHNLAEAPEYAAVLKDLTRRLRDWMQQQNDPILRGSEKPTEFYRRAVADLI